MPNDILTHAQCEDLKDMGLEQELFDGDWCYTDGPDGEELRLCGRDGISQEIILLSGYVKLPTNDELEEFAIGKAKELWPGQVVSVNVQTYSDGDILVEALDAGDVPAFSCIEMSAKSQALYALCKKLNEMIKEK